MFNDELIQKVWNKAYVMQGKNPDEYRQDKCGAMIKRDMYGKSASCSMGWEIDHIKPVQKGGTDELQNLQPLQWENKRNKNTNELFWSCRVTYSLDGNTYLTQETC